MTQGRGRRVWLTVVGALTLLSCGQAQASPGDARIIDERRLGPRVIELTISISL